MFGVHQFADTIGRGWIAIETAGTRQPPCPLAQPRERAQQDLVALSYRDRGDRHQVDRIAGASGQRRGIGSWLDDRDLFGPDAVRLERPHSRRSRDNARPCGRQRPPFTLLEPVGLLTIDADVGGKRQVDERNEVETPTFAFHLRRHRAERETVGEDEGTVRNRCKRVRRSLERRRGWPGKGTVELVDVDHPAACPQTSDDPAVVLIPAGSLCDRPWNDDRDPPHTRPSNDADARCDSWSVTRRLSIPAALDPTSPLDMAAAMPSKTARARNSVVVFLPLSEGSSSRFR